MQEQYSSGYFACAHNFRTTDSLVQRVSQMLLRDKVKAILKETGWNQTRFGNMVGVEQPTVSRWIRDENPDEPQGESRDEIHRIYSELFENSIRKVNPHRPPQDLEVDHGKAPGSGFKSATDEDIARMVRAEKIVDGKYLQSGLILPDEKRTEELAREYRRLTEQDERLRLTQSGAS
mgnify:CR=1 FL=1